MNRREGKEGEKERLGERMRERGWVCVQYMCVCEKQTDMREKERRGVCMRENKRERDWVCSIRESELRKWVWFSSFNFYLPIIYGHIGYTHRHINVLYIDLLAHIAYIVHINTCTHYILPLYIAYFMVQYVLSSLLYSLFLSLLHRHTLTCI